MKPFFARTGLVLIAWIMILGFGAVFSLPAADGADVAKVRAARDALEEITRIPEKAIPPALLRNAEGIAIIPGLIKAGFVLGGRHGNGIVLVRGTNGVWGTPRAISMSGVSIGWQIGVQSIDVILVFKTRKSVEDMSNRKWTLGVDGSVAAGPVGRHANVATDIWLKAEVFAYSRARGVFAGISVDGGVLQLGETISAPAETAELVSILNRYSGPAK